MTEDDVRRLALALPEVEERDHHGSPSFRVRDRIFVTLRDPGRANLKLPIDELTALVAERPSVFHEIVWGRDRRVGVVLTCVEEQELAELLETAWAEVAPKRLVRERFA